ncbi:RES family NAD+ phosphorylase [Methylomonas koyamae]|uniref:RES family NAD+ phosphorylase n=1 Tax=Methylomonas koyamae TaxID=702114 RepID=UPI0011292C7A|nr:RES family NAD+ phosphorylase [Methylomonas koyamae]TPQ27605.1 RES domain-containing protein [Methylomonas koyamae]
MSFKSWQSFRQFREKIYSKTRFVYDDETMSFIDEIIDTSKYRIAKLLEGKILWRAQIGAENEARVIYDDDDNPISIESEPYLPVRMYPRSNLATEGRVNPKGIPYLYLATDRETAMSECRPNIGTKISVGKFKIIRSLNIVDCSMNHASEDQIFYNIDTGWYEPDEAEREKAVWTDIDKAFSIPVNPNEDKAQYAPTQVIAEVFKSCGYDGIAYKSRLGKGCNIALFNAQDTELLKRYVFEVKDLNFEFEEVRSINLG